MFQVINKDSVAKVFGGKSVVMNAVATLVTKDKDAKATKDKDSDSKGA